MQLIYLVDFGSTFTKLTAIDIREEIIVATAKAPTTAGTNIMDGLEVALKQLEKKLDGRKFDVIEKLSSSSAAGGLRMSAIGLVPSLTMQAATTALFSSGAKLASCFSYEMVEEDIGELIKSRPDIVLLSGGTDGGNSSVILHNARMLSESKIEVPVIIAGNRSVRHAVRDELEKAGKEVIVAENVLPQLNKLNIDPVRDVVRELFIQRIIQAKGIDKAMEYVDKILMPTPIAVLRAAKLISEGCDGEQGMGELIIVDIGGATTDVHSVSKGLPQSSSSIFMKGIPEPYDKRTVEGDLGVRYNAKTILETVGISTFAENVNLSERIIRDWVERISTDVETLASDEQEKKIDEHLAYQACRLSVYRHAGYVESFYTPTGVTFAQYGKDLTEVRVLIGTGGPLIYIESPELVLGAALFDSRESERLRPKNPTLYLDCEYILYAVGLLAENYPKLALHIAKKYLRNISME
jgi:uncharacterized protein (TIGR01319 family)